VVAEALLDVLDALDAAAVELQDEPQDASVELQVVRCRQEPMVAAAAAAATAGELRHHHHHHRYMLSVIPLHILLLCRH
jgi:hypothetical protein